MGKIHLLFKKEEIDEVKIEGKIAVVFDVLLATSTITLGFHLGAKEVIPVQKGEEAHREAKALEPGSFLMVGESEGIALEGFLDPVTFRSCDEIKGKTVILCTTNGTVAIRKSASAEKVYIGSLLNAQAVAEKLQSEHADETVLMVCSGSSGAFCLEDFYGAGYLLDCLVSEHEDLWSLSDSAMAALLFYRGNQAEPHAVLQASAIGRMVREQGFADEVGFVSQRGILPMVPYLDGKRLRI